MTKQDPSLALQGNADIRIYSFLSDDNRLDLGVGLFDNGKKIIITIMLVNIKIMIFGKMLQLLKKKKQQ